MGLNWSVKDVANKDEVCFVTAAAADPMRGIDAGDRILNPVTEALVFLTMGTGIGWGITEDNIEEFVARVRMFEAVHGPTITLRNDAGEWVSTPLTEGQIRAHLGLHTNVSYEPRAEWLDRLFRTAYPAAGTEKKSLTAAGSRR